jgi:DNA-binding NarL/FixJ family response regulator
VNVVALSMYKKSSYIQRMLQFGAKGYLLKDDRADEILDAIRQVHQGHLYISSQIEPNLLSFTQSKSRDMTGTTCDVLIPIS